jgi:predicted nucleic acid-binding protein
MNRAILDTDMLTEVFKARNAVVVGHAADYLDTFGEFDFSAMTRFEVDRGLRYKQSARLSQRFEELCQRSTVLPINDEVLDRAASPWVTARLGGHPHRDADLIIASSALAHGGTLVTGNTPHFAWIPQLTLINWRDP